MKALVYHGPGKRSWDSVPDPAIIEATDAIVRIDTSTICGSDLHILKGDVPEVKPGTILGHEAVGTVTEVGAAVTTIRPGDRVLVSCISSCGRCALCKEGKYGLCSGGGGWIFGHLIDGLQAELARVPFADTSVYKVPETLSDEQVLFLADILPTAYEVGVLNGRVSPGDTVAIVGAGPIGLAAIMTAKLHTPGRIIAIDLADSRLERAREFGADETINNGREDAVARVMELTGGLGADVAIEAVGVPDTFELCTELIRPGGRVANVGVHGKCVTLHLERLWIRDVTITAALVNTRTIPLLLALIEAGRLDPTVFATHHFALADTEHAYDVFAAAAETHALKVVLDAVPVDPARNGASVHREPAVVGPFAEVHAASAGTAAASPTRGATMITHQSIAEWRGKALVDLAQGKIGKLEDVYVDVETDEPVFGTVREGLVGRHLTFVPLGSLTIGPDNLQIPVSSEQVRGAPEIALEGDELSQQDESALYHYYELNYTPPATESGRRLARR